jgi:hypothetical protein
MIQYSYETLQDALKYASTPQHTQFAEEFFGLINLLNLQAYASFGIGDIFGIGGH